MDNATNTPLRMHNGTIEDKDVNISRGNSCNSRKHILLRSLKMTLMLMCFVGFFFNSFIIFKQFIGNETVTSTKIHENKELYLPSITLCGFSGFKRIVDDYSDLKLENYVNNTIELNEILITAFDTEHNSIDPKDILEHNVNKTNPWKILTTFSAYRGRCYTIEYRKKVVARKGITILFHEDKEFWIYVHDKGEEFYLHYDFWPNVPFIHHSVPNEYFADVVVKKELEVQNENCGHQSYDYFDCLRDSFRAKVDSQNIKCTLPWIMSMSDKINSSKIPTCQTKKEFGRVSTIGHEFSKQLAKYNNSRCSAMCKKSSYAVAIQSFDKLSMIDIQEGKSQNENSTEAPARAVYLYYSTTDIKVSTTSKLISLSSFISSIGGNLGLFVGFSFLSTFFFFYNFLERAFQTQKSELNSNSCWIHTGRREVYYD